MTGALFRRRVNRLALLSIPSGMPLGWVFNTFQYFLVDLGTSRAAIGFLSAVSFPWTLKFLWAPLVDRFAFPWPGRRRSWLLVTLFLLAAVFGVLATLAAHALEQKSLGLPLGTTLVVVGLLAFAVAFISATFDIAYDAHAVEYLRPEEIAAAPGLRSAYYYGGVLLGGAVAVSLADELGWPGVFAALGVAFLACVPMVFLSRESLSQVFPRRTLRLAVVEPFTTYFRRPDAWALALFLIFYKFGDNIAGTMVNPFLRDLCFSNREAGVAVKGVGIAATIVGGLVGGAVVLRLGLWRALWLLGIAQALANLFYAVTAVHQGGALAASACGGQAVDASTRFFTYGAIAGEYVCKAMAATAQGALLLKVCDRANAVTQFALLTSLFALGRWLAGLPSGAMVDWLGYPMFFTVCGTLAALPGLYFLRRLNALQATAT